LRPIVLENDSERVLDLAFDAALDAEECCDGLGASEEHVGLVEAVGSETEGVAIARGVVFAFHVVQPRGAVEVVVNFCFVDVAECFFLHQLLDRLEIAEGSNRLTYLRFWKQVRVRPFSSASLINASASVVDLANGLSIITSKRC
jgi:hypothetical protein